MRKWRQLAGYGASECVIGQWRQHSADKGKLLTATKIRQLDHGSPEALRRSVYDKVCLSKQRLNVERIELLMVQDYIRIAGSEFDPVQIPLNLIDWRQIVNGRIEVLD